MKEDFEKLEQDIIKTKENLVGKKSSLATVLTQTRIFCKKLKEDYTWITNELEGYTFKNLGEANENIPKYRSVMYEFLDINNQVMILDFSKDTYFRENLLRGPLLIPITNLQGIHEGKVIIMHSGPPIELFNLLISKGMLKSSWGFNDTVGMSVRVSNSQLLTLYETVKNLTIEQLSKLEDKVKTKK